MRANACRNSTFPYGLRFPEDLAACSLVTQAVIGHEDRLVFNIALELLILYYIILSIPIYIIALWGHRPLVVWAVRFGVER